MELNHYMSAGPRGAKRAKRDERGLELRSRRTGRHLWRLGAIIGLLGASLEDGTLASDQVAGSAQSVASVAPKPGSSHASMAADGSVIAFQSTSNSLLPGDTSGIQHIYAFDRVANSLQRISVNAAGQPADKPSFGASVSGDGRFVAFASDATNLVPGDRNGKRDAFVKDRKTGEVTRVSVNDSGEEADEDCGEPAISADGKFVAFVSTATNFVEEDGNRSADVFLHDREAGTTRRISLNNAGEEADHASGEPVISTDGRYIAFLSHSRNLVAADTNNAPDIYLHDALTGQTEMVSVASSRVIGDRNSHRPSISADGRFVAFESWASNFATGDTNHAPDIFVRDRKEGTTTCISTTPTGRPSDDDSRDSHLAAGGRYIVFTSFADDLVPGDSNRKPDIFLRDRETGKTERINLSHEKKEANNRSSEPVVSADGRFVAFTSKASNLVAKDKDKSMDVFLVDRKKGEIRRISEAVRGAKAP